MIYNYIYILYTCACVHLSVDYEIVKWNKRPTSDILLLLFVYIHAVYNELSCYYGDDKSISANSVPSV